MKPNNQTVQASAFRACLHSATTLKLVAILAAISGGVRTPERLRRLFPNDAPVLRKRIYTLRKAGLLRPFRGGRDFRLETSDEGKRVMAGILHGLRALTAPRE